MFISFLGGSAYRPCRYAKDSYESQPMLFIQRATLEYHMSKENWNENSKVYILLTDGAEKANWIDNGINLYTGQPKNQLGLKSELEDMSVPFDIIPIRNIPEGKDEEDIWLLFKKMYEEIVLEKDDDLYLDVTHGFRYLPMLMLSYCKYVEFLKNVNIKSITYGNFESPLEIKPIMDLLPISVLQDWTYAAGQYIESGDVLNLVNLSNKELKPILKESKGQNQDAAKLRKYMTYLDAVISDFKACRGMNIIRSTNMTELKNISKSLDNVIIEPLKPIVEKIESSLLFFGDEENAKNCLNASKWCFDNRLYQQSATILQEFVITYFCDRHGIPVDDEEKREVVNQAFNLKFNHLESDENGNWSKVKSENKCYLKMIFEDRLFDDVELVNLFRNLSEVRNDFNHSGMRSKREPLSAKKIRDNVEKCLSGFAKLLYNLNY